MLGCGLDLRKWGVHVRTTTGSILPRLRERNLVADCSGGQGIAHGAAGKPIRHLQPRAMTSLPHAPRGALDERRPPGRLAHRVVRLVAVAVRGFDFARLAGGSVAATAEAGEGTRQERGPPERGQIAVPDGRCRAGSVLRLRTLTWQGHRPLSLRITAFTVPHHVTCFAQQATCSPRKSCMHQRPYNPRTSSMTAERRCKLGGRRRPDPEGPLRGTWLGACPLLVPSAASSPDDALRSSSGCSAGGGSAACSPPPSPAAAATSVAGCAAGEEEAAAGTGGAVATGVPADCCFVTNGDAACTTGRPRERSSTQLSGCVVVTPAKAERQIGGELIHGACSSLLPRGPRAGELQPQYKPVARQLQHCGLPETSHDALAK